MLFSRVLATTISLFTFGLTAAATPTKRSNADVQAIFTKLNGQTATILPQFATLAKSGKANDATVGPLITQLTTAINTAKVSMSGLSPSLLNRRQSNQDIANTVAATITNIANGLAPLQSGLVPGNTPSLLVFETAVDVALNELLVDLDIVIVGIVVLVGKLLVSIDVLLVALNLFLVAGSL